MFVATLSVISLSSKQLKCPPIDELTEQIMVLAIQGITTQQWKEIKYWYTYNNNEKSQTKKQGKENSHTVWVHLY